MSWTIEGHEGSEYFLPGISLGLSLLVIKKAKYDRTTNVLIYGEPRIGKSVYAIKVLKELCRYKGIQDPDYWRRFMIWDLKDLPPLIKEIRSSGKKAPGIVLDDFGVSAFAWNWRAPKVEAAMKMLETAGTLTDVMIMTSPSVQMVVKKALTLEGILIGKVVKRTDDIGAEGDSAKAHPFLRQVRLYRNSLMPWNKRYNSEAVSDTFSVRLDQRDYDWYKPVRESYLDRIREELERSINDPRAQMITTNIYTDNKQEGAETNEFLQESG